MHYVNNSGPGHDTKLSFIDYSQIKNTNMKTIYLIQDFTGFEPRVFATEEKTIAEKSFRTVLEECEKKYQFITTEKRDDERLILIEYHEGTEGKDIIFRTSVINLLEKGEDKKDSIIRPDNDKE